MSILNENYEEMKRRAEELDPKSKGYLMKRIAAEKQAGDERFLVRGRTPESELRSLGKTEDEIELIRAREYPPLPKTILRSGMFRCAYNGELAALIVTQLLALLTFGGAILMGNDASGISELFSHIFTAVQSVVAFIFEFAFMMVLYGKGYHYRLCDDALVITRHGRSEYFYYSETLDVSFLPFKRGVRQRGYIVTIRTNIKETQFRYITEKVIDVSMNDSGVAGFITDENLIYTGAEDSPFFGLMHNAGLDA